MRRDCQTTPAIPRASKLVPYFRATQATNTANAAAAAVRPSSRPAPEEVSTTTPALEGAAEAVLVTVTGGPLLGGVGRSVESMRRVLPMFVPALDDRARSRPAVDLLADRGLAPAPAATSLTKSVHIEGNVLYCVALSFAAEPAAHLRRPPSGCRRP
jgi:hypothetical protein